MFVIVVLNFPLLPEFPDLHSRILTFEAQTRLENTGHAVVPGRTNHGPILQHAAQPPQLIPTHQPALPQQRQVMTYQAHNPDVQQ